MKAAFSGLCLVLASNNAGCETQQDDTNDGTIGAVGITSRPDCEPTYSLECINDMCRKENQDCGSRTSVFDSNGCYRAKCITDAECNAGDECIELNYSQPACGFESSDGRCICGTLLMALTDKFCVPKLDTGSGQ